VAVVTRTVPAFAIGSPVPDPVGVAASLAPSDRVKEAASATPVPPASAARTPAPRPTPTPVPTPPPIATLSGYQWPLLNGRLTLPFGTYRWGSWIVDGKKFHDGIDLATFCGDRVVAAHDGVVLAASRRYDKLLGWIGDLKPYFDRLDRKQLWSTLPLVVVIDDGNGYRSVYAHFSKLAVKRGDTVKAGDFLGMEGMTGHATGCHLHYGLFSPLETATFAIDPVVMKRTRVPPAEIARIDPLLVLPPRPQDQPSMSPGTSASPGSSSSAGPPSGPPSPSASPLPVPLPQ
jgi:murein DD-endopeptidase MepM/ murein hydrolase activator NlpD